ncbi:MAG: amino acid ABC transporter substrate-binding protein [Ruminococcaceae bacterium]|nr:amino acid ABC transporter substrate-binding protein [Oscillospiraceae bacterium]
MKNVFFKALALCLCLVMVGAIFAGCNKKEEEAIVIGFSGPLTGAAAVYGTAVKNSAEMAVEEINAAGGLNGIPLKLESTDDKHDPSLVETNYNTLMDKGMQVSLGTVTTAPGLEFKALAKNDNVFFLTPSASGDKIPEFDNGYQMCFADGNQGKVAAEYVNGLSYTEIGIFYKSDDPYSKGIYDQFKDNLKDGIKTVDAAFTGEANDFTAQIELVKNCKFIFMPIYYTPASIFMKQAKAIIAADAIYYGCDGFDGLEGQLGEDMPTIPQQIIMLSHFNSKATDGKAADFVKKYTEKFGTDTLNQFGAAAYDCIYALHAAMDAAIKAGKKIDADTSASDLCEILKEQFNGDFKFSGATGTDIKWQTNGFVEKAAVAYVIKEKNA